MNLLLKLNYKLILTNNNQTVFVKCLDRGLEYIILYNNCILNIHKISELMDEHENN